jgi:predicted porin
MKRAIFTTLFVVCAALPALSAELEFSGAGEVEYDDNVFREAHDKDDDGLFRLRPSVRVYEDRGDDLNFSAGYTAPVEFSVNQGSEFTEVDHIGDGRFTYHVNERLELFANEHYGYIRSTTRQQDVEFNDQRDRVKVNAATLGTVYHFSPRTTGRVAASSSFFDSSRDDRARVWSVGGTADLQRKLTLKHQLGAGAGYSFQDFSDRDDIPGSQTDTYRIFGTWRWTISQTLTFDLNAGPAYLETDQDTASNARRASRIPFAVRSSDGALFVAAISNCGTIDNQQVASACAFSIPAAASDVAEQIDIINVNPQGQSDSEVTGFVDATLSQRWSPTLATALRYSRQQGDASGLGGTVVVDAVSLSNTWDFAERWQLALRGDWVRRESAFDLARTFDVVVGGPSPGGPIATRTGQSFNSKQNVQIDTDRWGVAARITHQLFKNTSLYGQVRYDEQDSRGDSLGSGSDFENFLATFGVRHVFEPIPLW